MRSGTNYRCDNKIKLGVLLGSKVVFFESADVTLFQLWKRQTQDWAALKCTKSAKKNKAQVVCKILLLPIVASRICLFVVATVLTSSFFY